MLLPYPRYRDTPASEGCSWLQSLSLLGKVQCFSTKAQRDLVTDDRVRRGSDSDADTDHEDDSTVPPGRLRAMPMCLSSAP